LPKWKQWRPRAGRPTLPSSGTCDNRINLTWQNHTAFARDFFRCHWHCFQGLGHKRQQDLQSKTQNLQIITSVNFRLSRIYLEWVRFGLVG
jgi:hypothetical protein